METRLNQEAVCKKGYQEKEQKHMIQGHQLKNVLLTLRLQGKKVRIED
jgi:hypothetical protein